MAISGLKAKVAQKRLNYKESVKYSQKSRFFGISETRFFEKTGFLDRSSRDGNGGRSRG